MQNRKKLLPIKSQHKNSGFTLLEVIAVITIGGAIITLTLQQSRVFNKRTTGTQIATETLGYAKLANRFINNHYQDIYETTKTTPVVINLSQITSEIKLPMMPKRNLQGLIPCVWVTQSGNQIQPYMFFVNPPDGKYSKPTPDLAYETMQKIGPQSGFVETNGIAYGLYKGWQFPVSSFATNSCGGSVIAPDSIVMNLGMMQDLHIPLQPDISLHRPEDQTTNPGDSNNSNTMQTTLDVANVDNGVDNPHRIVFNNSTNVGFQAASSYQQQPSDRRPQDQFLKTLGTKTNLLVVRSGTLDESKVKNTSNQGSFTAKTIQPTLQVDQGASCDASEIGASAIMKPNQTNAFLRGLAVCTKNPVYCSRTGDEDGNTPCWLPTTSYSIIFDHPLPDYSVNCSTMVAPGFHIVPGSITYVAGPGPGAFGYSPGTCCRWNPENVYSTKSEQGVSGFIDIYKSSAKFGLTVIQGEKIVQKYGAVRDGDFCPTDCGNYYVFTPVRITSVTCSNDTSDFEYKMTGS